MNERPYSSTYVRMQDENEVSTYRTEGADGEERVGLRLGGVQITLSTAGAMWIADLLTAVALDPRTEKPCNECGKTTSEFYQHMNEPPLCIICSASRTGRKSWEEEAAQMKGDRLEDLKGTA